MQTHEGASERRPPSARERKRWQGSYLQTRRLLLAARVFYRRYWFEQTLILQDQEPRFHVSWDKLTAIADNPQWLVGGFNRFMHRLHRLAQSETDEAARAYHAVSQPAVKPGESHGGGPTSGLRNKERS